MLFEANMNYESRQNNIYAFGVNRVGLGLFTVDYS